MRDAVICSPLRTPVGRFGGVFREVPATVLAETVASNPTVWLVVRKAVSAAPATMELGNRVLM